MVCHGMSFSHLLPSCKAPTSNIHRSTWSRFPDFFGTALLRQGCTCGGKQGVNGTQPPRITSDIGGSIMSFPWSFHGDPAWSACPVWDLAKQKLVDPTVHSCSAWLLFSDIALSENGLYTQSMAIPIRNIRFLCSELFKHPWEFGVLPWFYHHFDS